MNRHFPDPSEALKRTHDGVATHRNLSPTSTVRTGQSSKKRAVYNQTPVKSSTGHSRKDKHLTGVPCERKLLDGVNTDRWNLSYQALRLEKEWTELDLCRNMKRNSEIVQHRIDNMYMMSGSGIRLKPKYDVNESELEQLKDLSRARQVLRDKSKKNQSLSKGRLTSLSGRESSKGVKNNAPHPEIRIHGDSQKDRANTENPSQADWSSDPGSRPMPSPRTPPGNHGDTVTDEAGKIIDKNEINVTKDDAIATVEGEENKENVNEDPKGSEGQEGGAKEGLEGVAKDKGQEGMVKDEGQQGEGAPEDENSGDGKPSEDEKDPDEKSPTEEEQAGVETENDKDVSEDQNLDKDVDEDKNVIQEDEGTNKTENRTEKENEEENVEEKGDNELVEEQTAEENVK